MRKREVLSLASQRFLGIDFPRGRDLGPVVMVWLLSLMVLVLQFDLGMSLLYFGMFVSTLYIATERVSWLIIGLLLFFGGAVLAYLLGESIGGPFANFYQPGRRLARPVRRPDRRRLPAGAGPARARYRRPVRRRAGRRLARPRCRRCTTTSSSPALGEEIGLFGLTALLVCTC